MSSIFSKESTIKQFPDLGQNYVQPTFIEGGIMPDRKGHGKTKSCQIYINNAGIFFLRPFKLSKGFKVSIFIPVDTISELFYDNQKRRTIVWIKGRTFYECAHIERSIECILASRIAFLPNSPQIMCANFPQPPTAAQPSVPVEKNSLLRYINLCFRNEGGDYDPSVLQFLASLNSDKSDSVVFDSNCVLPRKCSILFKSMRSEKIRSIHFKNVAPYGVCRYVHFIIKRLSTVTSIVFEGYTTLIPEQLRTENLKPRIPLSFAFVNCQFTDKCFIDLIEKLSNLNGEIQKFSIVNMTLSADSWNYLFYAFDSFKPWNTLEYFEMNQIDLKTITPEEVSTSILILQRRCRFIQYISLSNWVQPIPIDIDSFSHSSALSQLVLKKQDFTGLNNDKARLPTNIVYIDVGQSSFTLASLQSFFRLILSIPKKPIFLNFSDIKMQDGSWNQFYSSLSSLSEINNIKGLDWSGNPIDSSCIMPFCQFFFAQNNVSHLSIDRIFNNSQIDDLRNLVNSIGPNKIYSLSICGNSNHNFGGSMSQFLDIINSLGNNLLIIHIDGHKVSSIDSPAVINFIRNHNSIVELSMDDTTFSDENQLFNFYENIFSNQNIKILGRPNIDLERILGGPGLSYLSDRTRFLNFQNNFHSKEEPIQQSLLAYYLCRYSNNFTFEAQRYCSYFSKCPNIFIPLSYRDDFCLKFTQKKHYSISFSTLYVREPCNSLSELQSKRLIKPDRPPNYRSTKYGILKPVQVQIPLNDSFSNNTYNDSVATTFNSKGSDTNYSNYNSNNFNSIDISNNSASAKVTSDFNNFNNASNNNFGSSVSNSNFENNNYAQQSQSQFGGMAGVASSGIQLEPLADTPEMKSVLSILSGIFDDDEQSSESSQQPIGQQYIDSNQQQQSPPSYYSQTQNLQQVYATQPSQGSHQTAQKMV